MVAVVRTEVHKRNNITVQSQSTFRLFQKEVVIAFYLNIAINFEFHYLKLYNRLNLQAKF